MGERATRSSSPSPMLDHEEAARGARFGERLRGRLMVGAVVGAAIGALVGGVIGATTFGRIGPTIALALGGVIAIGGLGAFWGGMAALESPDPTVEPSQTEEPLEEPPTRHERAP